MLTPISSAGSETVGSSLVSRLLYSFILYSADCHHDVLVHARYNHVPRGAKEVPGRA